MRCIVYLNREVYELKSKWNNIRKYLINQRPTFLSWVNYIKARAKQSSHVLRTTFPTQSTPIFSIMLSDRALSQQFFLKHRHTSISAHIHAFLKYTHKHSNTQSQTLRQTQVHTRERTTALSPWLGQAICLSPPSPLTAAVCPGSERARNPPVWSNSILIS